MADASNTQKLAVLTSITNSDYVQIYDETSRTPKGRAPKSELFQRVVATVTADTTLTAAHDLIFADSTAGNVTLTLPTAVGISGTKYTVKKIVAGNSVILDGNGAETIDGAATFTMVDNNEFVAVVSDNANWKIVNDDIITLQADLDANGNNIEFNTNTGINDDDGNEQISFVKAGSAINFVSVTNAVTATAPTIMGTGSETNVGLKLATKGSGSLQLDAPIQFVEAKPYQLQDVAGLEILTLTSVGTDVNYLQISANSTGNNVLISGLGDDADVGISLIPKGTGNVAVTNHIALADTKGIVDGNGLEVLVIGETASAVNEVKITNAATGNGPVIGSQGDDANVDLNFGAKGSGKLVTANTLSLTAAGVEFLSGQGLNDDAGNPIIVLTKTASAVNEITIANAATGSGPTISTTGDDANVPLTIAPKGTGALLLESPIQLATASASTIQDSTGAEILVFNEATTPVNYFQITNAATAAHPNLFALGDDTNVALGLVPKGTGNVLITNNLQLADTKGIVDGNGLEVLLIGQTASAVNEFKVTNAATGNSPILAATGDDANIDITLTPKGTGDVNLAAGALNVAGTQVLGAQAAAEADPGAVTDYTATGGGAVPVVSNGANDLDTCQTGLALLEDEVTAIRTSFTSLLAKLRTHGIIAT